MASLPGSRTAGFIASPPAVSKPCGLPFASVVSTFPAPSGKPKLHETSALMSIPGEELHISLSPALGEQGLLDQIIGSFIAACIAGNREIRVGYLGPKPRDPRFQGFAALLQLG